MRSNIGLRLGYHESNGMAVRAADEMIAADRRVNGEFYVDSCVNDAIALGLQCALVEVDHFLCWGTPDELRTRNARIVQLCEWADELLDDRTTALARSSSITSALNSVGPRKPPPSGSPAPWGCK